MLVPITVAFATLSLQTDAASAGRRVFLLDGPADGHQTDVCPLCAHAAAALGNPRLPDRPGGVAGECSLLSDTDVLHYDLELEVIPPTKTLTGTNVITAMSLTEGLSCFEFELSSTFVISALTVNGVEAAWDRLDAVAVSVTMPEALGLGEVFEVSISYSGVPVAGGFGSINFTSASGQPLVFTLSEPFYAHTWWPVKEDSTDKATGDIRIIAPAALKVASNGLLQSDEPLPGDRHRVHWSTQYPTAPYLFSFSAGNYATSSDVWQYGKVTMPLDFYIHPSSNTPANLNAWKKCIPMLTVMSDLFGIYPFAEEKYGIYQFGFGGGMEHQTMSGQGSFSESLTAHELGHQWWGNMVTCGTWGDIWLNEGFATYSEALWYEFDGVGNPVTQLAEAMQSRKPTNFNVTVFRYDTSSASVIFSSNGAYRKGAWVLHMLRRIMGDGPFFQMLLDYREAYEHSTAVTADLVAIAEAVHGSDLDWYFQPWIYQPGGPSYQHAFKNHTIDGAHYVELAIKQTQSAAYPTYAMPIDMGVTVGGTTTIATIWNDERTQHYLLPTTGPVTATQLDPGGWLLRETTQSVAFFEGPPRLVSAAPAPGSRLDTTGELTIELQFHENVQIDETMVKVNGADEGPIPFELHYSPATFSALITLTQVPPPGALTVTVNETITDAGGIAFDGDTPADAPPFPTGDGVPGGPSTLFFTVASPFDLSADGVIDGADLGLLLGAWGTADAAADLNGDGTVDGADLGLLLGNWSR